nr:uncharacterized protein LOC111420436 [Onthophagus taurus]
MKLILLILSITPLISSGVLRDKTPPSTISSNIENFFKYFDDNKDSLFSIYKNARFITNILEYTNAPLMNTINELIPHESTIIGRSIRSLDSIINEVQNSVDYVPKMINTMIVPQVLEKLKLGYEEFFISGLGTQIMERIDLEKIKTIFMDEKSRNFSYDKFVELMENHAFRKYWINEATKEIRRFISFYVDPKTHEKYVTLTLSTINNFIGKFGFPKTKFNNLNETIILFINDVFKIESEKYIQPLFNYFNNLVSIINDKEILEETLTNTVNMDIIEPTLRVNRAYRFIIENPYCDRYVMCLVNAEEKDDPKLPGVKKVLSKTASLIASWFLAGKSQSSFGTLYKNIVDFNDCNEIDESRNCLHFHVEEMKVKQPYIYVHKEL